jgi:hypothetical protein
MVSRTVLQRISIFQYTELLRKELAMYLRFHIGLVFETGVASEQDVGTRIV